MLAQSDPQDNVRSCAQARAIVRSACGSLLAVESTIDSVDTTLADEERDEEAPRFERGASIGRYVVLEQLGAGRLAEAAVSLARAVELSAAAEPSDLAERRFLLARALATTDRARARALAEQAAPLLPAAATWLAGQARR